MGGLCTINRNLSSEISVPTNSKLAATSKSKGSLLLASPRMRGSIKCKYSKTDEDVSKSSFSKKALLKESQKSFKSKRSVKVKETDQVFERRNTDGEKIINHYILLNSIGEGSFGKVKLAKRRFIDFEEHFAVKIIRQKSLNSKKINFDEKGELIRSDPVADIKREIAIMKKLNHPNVIKLHEVIQDQLKDKIYMIMEYASQGTLITWDENTKKFNLNADILTEEYIRTLFRDCIKGLHYIHQNGIIHRDIKPQNILLDSDGFAKLSDFGVSIIIENDDDRMKNMAGTYQFMSPETLNSKNKKGFSGQSADIWSLGVTFYCFFFLELPFYSNNLNGIIKTISNKRVTFPKEKKISEGFKNLLKGMLIKNPKKRWTIEYSRFFTKIKRCFRKISNNSWVNQHSHNLADALKDQKIIMVDQVEVENAWVNIERVVFLKQVAKKWKSSIKSKSFHSKDKEKSPANNQLEEEKQSHLEKN